MSKWIVDIHGDIEGDYEIIKKYEEPKTGHWVEEKVDEWSRKIFCSECGFPVPFEHVSDGDVYSANGHGVINKTKFCPNCGAMMIESQESEEKK